MDTSHQVLAWLSAKDIFNGIIGGSLLAALLAIPKTLRWLVESHKLQSRRQIANTYKKFLLAKNDSNIVIVELLWGLTQSMVMMVFTVGAFVPTLVIGYNEYRSLEFIAFSIYLLVFFALFCFIFMLRPFSLAAAVFVSEARFLARVRSKLGSLPDPESLGIE